MSENSKQRMLIDYPVTSNAHDYMTTKVQVSDRNIEEKLYLSHRENTSKDFWSLVKELECDARDLRDRLKYLLSMGEIKISDGDSIDKSTIQLTEIGLSKVEASSLSKENKLALDSIRIREAVSSFVKRVPSPMPALAQYFFMPDTVGRLYRKMIEDKAVENKNVICLGVPTIGLGISISRRARKVTVVDIDDDLLDVLDKEANKWKAQVEIIPHDLRQRLPSDMYYKYHTFVIDPVYTSAAYELFLSRGIQALRKGAGGMGYFPLPKYMKNDGRLYDSVLNIVRSMKLEHSIIEKFVETDVPPFEEAVLERLGFASIQPWRVASLIVVRTTALSRPIVKGKAKKSIYPSKLMWIKLPYGVASRTTAHRHGNNLILITPRNINYIFNEVAWFILLYVDRDIEYICSEIKKNFSIRKGNNVENDVMLFLEKLKKDETIKGPIPIELIESLGLHIQKRKYTRPLLHKILSLSVLGGFSNYT